MIKSLRLRLTISFVALSALVCATLAALGITFLYGVLTADLDDYTRLLASSFGHAIEVEDDKPVFRNWERVVQTEPARSLAAIELFAPDGILLEAYGPKSLNSLFSQQEITAGGTTWRLRSTPLTDSEHRVIGFMQIGVSTAERDAAVRQACLTLAVLAPLLMFGLSVISYFVSGKAVRPLEENIESMRALVADAGHELNTPLAIIAARAESMQRKLERSGMETADADVILRSAERTSRLANDLLLLSELEGAQGARRSSSVALDELLREVVQDFRERFAEKHVALNANINHGVIIEASHDELYRAFANLLENALRYTESGGSAAIGLEPTDAGVRVSITDTGIGIPDSSLGQIFNRFYRVDKSRARDSGGAGLGLPIAKAILEAHHASIAVASVLGSGTTFTVNLRRTPNS